MVPQDDSTAVTPFVRDGVPGSANVLLVASDDAPAAGTACQTLLTTVSERSERVLAVEYGAPKYAWLDQLRHEPANLRRTRIAEGNSLPARVEGFLRELGEGETGLVYVDSISALASDVGVDTATSLLDDAVRALTTADEIGLFRVDPGATNVAPFERLVDYTAEYVPDEQGWRISKVEA